MIFSDVYRTALPSDKHLLMDNLLRGGSNGGFAWPGCGCCCGWRAARELSVDRGLKIGLGDQCAIHQEAGGLCDAILYSQVIVINYLLAIFSAGIAGIKLVHVQA